VGAPTPKVSNLIQVKYSFLIYKNSCS